MSLTTMHYYSNCLRREVTFQAIIPLDHPAEHGKTQHYATEPLKALYLLNGYSGSCNDWLTYSSIRDLAQQNRLAVFMPSGENHFYVDDEAKGEMFGEFIGEELIAFTRAMFPISNKREDTFIGGLSMGGYGAVRNGLKYSHNFSKVIAMSSAFITYKIANAKPGYSDGIASYSYFDRVFGNLNELEGSDKDLEALVRAIQENKKQMPELYLSCGDEDFLLDVNIKFHNYLKQQNIKHVYEQSPGVHDWNFWREYIVKGIKWALAD